MKTYDLAGYTLVLDKIAMVSAVFKSAQNEGWQFNIQLVSGQRVAITRPDRAQALLDRELLVKAINAQA